MIRITKFWRSFRPLGLIGAFYHISIALLPVLYLLWVPGLNLSFGTVILLGFIPYAFYYILKGVYVRNSTAVFFFLFYGYLILRFEGNISRIMLGCSAFLHLYGMMKGSINSRKIRNIIEIYSLLNVVLLMTQLVSYYFLHIRLQYIPQQLIYEEYRNSFVFAEVSGLYRPSALFLEPSHFTQYCIYGLISTLFPGGQQKIKLNRAILIGMGCIFTTSGMGIVLTAGVFAWYVILNNQSLYRKILSWLKWIPLAAVALLVLLQIPFFKVALQRIFSSVDGYNAIAGRTHNWEDAIGNMNGSTLLFGYGDQHNYEWYITGFVDTIYKYGVVGVILEALCILNLMAKKIDNYVWCCCVVFTGLFFVAHLTNFVSHVFYFGIVIADIIARKEKIY